MGGVGVDGGHIFSADLGRNCLPLGAEERLFQPKSELEPEAIGNQVSEYKKMKWECIGQCNKPALYNSEYEATELCRQKWAR